MMVGIGVVEMKSCKSWQTVMTQQEQKFDMKPGRPYVTVDMSRVNCGWDL